MYLVPYLFWLTAIKLYDIQASTWHLVVVIITIDTQAYGVFLYDLLWL